MGVETEISVVDLLVAEFSPKPIATPASPVKRAQHDSRDDVEIDPLAHNILKSIPLL